MRSDNGNKTMRFNRFLAQWKVLPLCIILIDIIIFCCFNYLLNTVAAIPDWMVDKQHPELYFGIVQILPALNRYGRFVKGIYVMFALFLLFIDVLLIYKIRISFAESDINIGSEGTSRWTTIDEIKHQYKAIPLSKECYKGTAGTIISRIRDNLYVDDSVSNTVVLGTTRSGKGQMYVIPTIDAYSRAESIKDRPSMIINDPKLELYKSTKAQLEKRGYIVRLLNLIDPNKSMGFDPVQIVKEHYKAGRQEKAQMAARAFAFSVFNSNEDTQEAIWKNTATSLYTALIVAIVTDCIAEDQELNLKRKAAFEEKQISFMRLEEGEASKRRKEFDSELLANVNEKDYDYVLSPRIEYIPSEITFEEIYPNEKKANCFSCLNFFRELCDRVSMQVGGPNTEGYLQAFNKKAETALDDYFNQRPPLDYARSLYQEIKSAGDRTKGSVYINMQSALSVFTLSSIAKMTAESDFDIDEIGYGDKPVAIFMAIPANDRSNYFLATTFIAQVYQYLYDLAMNKTGVLRRRVKFILDEFGNLPVIENFAGFVTVCLGIGVSFDIYLQSYNQIYGRYKDEAKTILENFANQIYIMSVGKESAEEFSEMLGNRTEIDLERSGGRFSLNKQYMERSKERPLMYPQELSVLREGECVVYRGMKRSDRLGVAIKSHPIINEYREDLSLITYMQIFLKMIKHRLIEKRAILHPSDGYVTTWKQEWSIRVNDKKRFLGTALLYAYQYLTELPDPKNVDFDRLCNESRAHIDIMRRIYDPENVLDKIMRKGSQEERQDKTVKQLNNYMQIKYKLMSLLGSNFMNELGIGEDEPVESFIASVTSCKALDERSKGEIKFLIAKGRGR